MISRFFVTVGMRNIICLTISELQIYFDGFTFDIYAFALQNYEKYLVLSPKTG